MFVAIIQYHSFKEWFLGTKLVVTETVEGVAGIHGAEAEEDGVEDGEGFVGVEAEGGPVFGVGCGLEFEEAAVALDDQVGEGFVGGDGVGFAGGGGDAVGPAHEFGAVVYGFLPEGDAEVAVLERSAWFKASASTQREWTSGGEEGERG